MRSSDEARRRDELVRARSVHAGGVDLRVLGSLAAVLLLLIGKAVVLERITNRFDAGSGVEVLVVPDDRGDRLLVGLTVGAIGSGLVLSAASCKCRLASRREHRGRRSSPAARSVGGGSRRTSAFPSPRSSFPSGASRRDRRRPRRPDQLRQDPFRAGVPRRDGAGRLRGAAACSPRRRTRRLAAQLGAERVGLVTGEERVNEARPDHLLYGRDGAAFRRGARARRGAVV